MILALLFILLYSQQVFLPFFHHILFYYLFSLIINQPQLSRFPFTQSVIHSFIFLDTIAPLNNLRLSLSWISIEFFLSHILYKRTVRMPSKCIYSLLLVYVYPSIINWIHCLFLRRIHWHHSFRHYSAK